MTKQRNNYSKLTTIKNGTPVTTTQNIAVTLKMRHAKVIEVINNLFTDFHDLKVLSKDSKINDVDECFIPYEFESKGKPVLAYILNEPAFSLLLPRFKTRQAKEAYRAFNRSFYEIRKALLQQEVNQQNLLFKHIRKQSKVTRQAFTDSVERFVKYAQEQGSSSTTAITIKNFTVWLYKSLGVKQLPNGNTRDALPSEMLRRLEELETLIAEHLSNGIERNLPYKQLRSSVRALLEL